MLSLVTGPTMSILNEAEFKSFARVGTTQDDQMIISILKSSISWAENEVYIDTMPRQWLQKCSGGVDKIELLKSPVQSVDEVKYFDDFDSTGYLMTESTDFRVVDKYLIHESGHWDKQRDLDGYQIKYTTGLFTNTSTNDFRLEIFKTAALKCALWIYENREMYVTGINESFAVSYNTEKIPPEITRLLRPLIEDVIF
jgi:hypothetical protein